MGDSTLTTDLGHVLVTGGSGFVGANLVTELLGRGHAVRSFDRVASPLPPYGRLETIVADITNSADVAKAVAGVDTVIHTAAIIDLMGGGSAPVPKPLMEPLAVERIYLDSYYSVAKAERDLGHRPLFTTEEAMAHCLPYYTDLFEKMEGAGKAEPANA